MKKGLVFLLCAVAALGAHANLKDLPRFASLKSNLKHHVRSLSECVALECVEKGKQCNSSTSACMSGTSCLGGVCRGPQVGDECQSYCGSDLYCKDNKCAERLGEGATCTGSSYYECESGLECDSTSKKCTKPVPAKKGEACEYYSDCDEDLFCKYNRTSFSYEGVCSEYKAAGEECDAESDRCVDGHVCASDGSKITCMYALAKKGEFCDTEGKIICIPGYKCSNNKCVEGDETCSYDMQCKDPHKHTCYDGKCVKFGSLTKGEECYRSSQSKYDIDDLMEASLLCQEGLGCVPDVNGTKATCEEITTKLEDKKTCSDENPCPSDSFCECNDETGITMCIPYASFSEEAIDDYKDAMKKMYECYDKKSLEKMETCYMESYFDLYQLLETYEKKFYSYDADYRCAELTGAASSIKATFAFVFSILALIFLF